MAWRWAGDITRTQPPHTQPRVPRPKGPRRPEAGGWLGEGRDPAVSTQVQLKWRETARTPLTSSTAGLAPICCATGGVTSH